MKIIVDRATWGRGGDKSFLLNEVTGRRCCIGFVCQQIGLTDEALDRVGVVPDVLGPGRDAFEEAFPRCGMADLEDAYRLNDETTRSDQEREAALIEWGKPVGIEFEFVDGDQT